MDETGVMPKTKAEKVYAKTGSSKTHTKGNKCRWSMIVLMTTHYSS